MTEDDTYLALIRASFQEVRNVMRAWYDDDEDGRNMEKVVESLHWTMSEYKAECYKRGLGLIHTTRI